MLSFFEDDALHCGIFLYLPLPSEDLNLSGLRISQGSLSLMVLMITLSFTACRGLTYNQAETSPDHSDSSLRTRTYSIAYDSFFTILSEVIKELPRWKILSLDLSSGEVLATRESRVFHFVDDVRILVVKKEEQELSVNIRSASRIGKGDFGQNARNIRGLLKGLDQKILN